MFHYNQSKLDSVVAGIGEWNYFVCLMDNSIRALRGDETNRITELGPSHPSSPHPLPNSRPTLSTDSLQTNATSRSGLGNTSYNSTVTVAVLMHARFTFTRLPQWWYPSPKNVRTTPCLTVWRFNSGLACTQGCYDWWEGLSCVTTNPHIWWCRSRDAQCLIRWC